ncbi:DUF4307 domain-containing protein [Micromonospora sp. LOL_023]|uniref:DUF4307 domain-containing protein n=1 Tax=Micromonospora sp. LOL_023 TaxID=3345418 RepID=UPI003A83E830
MTDTSATTAPTAAMFPPGRYGRRRAPRTRRPWLVALLATVAVLVGMLVTVRLYTLYGDPTYDPKVITYTEATTDGILIDFTVTVPPGGSANCLVRARSHDGVEVGRDQVTVRAEPGERQIRTTYRLATERQAFLGEVIRCQPVG